MSDLGKKFTAIFDGLFGAPKKQEPVKRRAKPAAAAPVRSQPANGARAIEAAAKRRAVPTSQPPVASFVDQDDEADVIPIRAPGAAIVPEARSKEVSFVNAELGRPRVPEETESDDLVGFQGNVLTAPGGPFPLTPRQCQFIAALDNGTLLIASSAISHPAVSSAKSLLKRGNFEASQTFLVEMELIRTIYERFQKRSGSSEYSRDTATMQRVVLDLIRTAALQKCSDIHIGIGRHEARVRVRSDGVMMPLRELSSTNAQELLIAAFNMADASDSNYRPMESQGARITSLKTTLPEGVQAVRLQFNPLPDQGRHCVMRLLYSQRKAAHVDVDELGYAQHHIKQIKRMRDKPYGINIISGPTGSGKSTTLQTSLQATIRQKNYEVNVMTVEDPPEYEIRGAIQLPVTNVKTESERNEAFRQTITAALRSDPDILMIGEIRDASSSGLAFQAAMTGHQVWASLHANNAISIIDRLKDLKVEPYKLADCTLLTGLIGQRLVRQLCKHCRMPTAEALEKGVATDDEVRVLRELFGDETVDRKVFFANPQGCAHCRGGYNGRSVVAETILPDDKFMEHVAKNDKIAASAYWLEHLEGMTMLEHAILKVAAGEVDAKEVSYKVGIVDELDPERVKRFLGVAVDALQLAS